MTHRPWYILQDLEFISSPTSIHYHRIEKYSSILESVQRVRRVLGGAQPSENELLLIQACARNDIDAVEFLLSSMDIAPIDLRRGLCRSALHEAALHRNGRSLVRLLYRHGADPKQRDSLGRTPIHYAASYGHLDIVADLIEFSGVAISTLVDTEGRCPLMYACGEGHVSVCRWLIEYGDADFFRQDNRGRSCLSYACRGGHTKLVEWLLPLLPPASTYSGWHPLHYACSAGHLDIVKLLLEYDQNTGHVVTHTGHSALFFAMHSTKNSLEMTKCLINSSLTVQLTSQDIQDISCNETLIFLLAQRRHSLTYLLDIIEKLGYPLALIRLLLLSEHIYSKERLLRIPRHQSLINHQLRNPLTLKQILRCSIRKSIDTSNKFDLLEINQGLKKFLRFEYL